MGKEPGILRSADRDHLVCVTATHPVRSDPGIGAAAGPAFRRCRCRSVRRRVPPRRSNGPAPAARASAVPV